MTGPLTWAPCRASTPALLRHDWATHARNAVCTIVTTWKRLRAAVVYAGPRSPCLPQHSATTHNQLGIPPSGPTASAPSALTRGARFRRSHGRLRVHLPSRGRLSSTLAPTLKHCSESPSGTWRPQTVSESASHWRTGAAKLLVPFFYRPRSRVSCFLRSIFPHSL